MSRYHSIAVIYGSDSSEWEVACRSGEFTASRIDEFQYDVYEIFARFGDLSNVIGFLFFLLVFFASAGLSSKSLSEIGCWWSVTR